MTDLLKTIFAEGSVSSCFKLSYQTATVFNEDVLNTTMCPGAYAYPFVCEQIVDPFLKRFFSSFFIEG